GTGRINLTLLDYTFLLSMVQGLLSWVSLLGGALTFLSSARHRACCKKPRRFLAYILLSGAVPGPTGAALLCSWLGWGRPGVTAGPPFYTMRRSKTHAFWPECQ